MIEIKTTIIWNNDENTTIGYNQAYPDELFLLPEFLDEVFEHTKHKIKDYVRNTPDREFNAK